MVNSYSYALKLETAFQLSSNPARRFVTADDFSQDFVDALERGLQYFAGCGLFPQREIASMVEEYTRLGKSLQKILETEEGRKQIEELINQIYALKRIDRLRN